MATCEHPATQCCSNCYDPTKHDVVKICKRCACEPCMCYALHAPVLQSENDRWWQAFASGAGIMALDAEQKTTYATEVASLAADYADAAIDEARKRGRL
jgi:hypothetical protein